jgi:hypothetical protein
MGVRHRPTGGGERVHLYRGSTRQFIADVTQARLAQRLSDWFFDEYPPPAIPLRGHLVARLARGAGARPQLRRAARL